MINVLIVVVVVVWMTIQSVSLAVKVKVRQVGSSPSSVKCTHRVLIDLPVNIMSRLLKCCMFHWNCNYLGSFIYCRHINLYIVMLNMDTATLKGLLKDNDPIIISYTVGNDCIWNNHWMEQILALLFTKLKIHKNRTKKDKIA